MARRKPAPVTGKKGSSGLWLILLLALPLAWCKGSDRETTQTAPSSPPAAVASVRPNSPPVSEPQAPAPARSPTIPPASAPTLAPAPAPAAAPSLVQPPSQPAALSVSPDPPPAIPTETLYTTSRINVREQPSGSGRVLGSLDAGSAVDASDERGEWRRVTFRGREAWVSSRHLSDRLPTVSPPAQTSQTVTRLVQESEPDDDAGGGFEPIRAPYVGRCDCPYDEMRNGRSCGGRSAYSRPGGRKPRCYR